MGVVLKLNTIHSLYSYITIRAKIGQSEGKVRMTYPYPLYALSLPSLCPLFATNEYRLNSGGLHLQKDCNFREFLYYP